MKYLVYIIIILAVCHHRASWAQRVPNEAENIDYLVTYGKNAPLSAGDYDHVQIIFFTIPLPYREPVYIRIYDPDIGGKHDKIKGTADTQVRYSIYGGKGAFSNKDAQQVHPKGNFKSGSLIASKTFGADPRYDDNWFTLGVLNPLQGEKSEALNGFAFKLVIEGLQNDDGNLYRCFLSQMPNINQAIPGANAFAYEYTFQLPKIRGISHIYPFIAESVTSVIQSNFDYDGDGNIWIYSVKKNHHIAKASQDGEWASSRHKIVDGEKNTTIDIQIQKNKEGENAMSFYITNQYDRPIPFFAIPIGGPPKYKYNAEFSLLKSENKE